MKSRLISLTLSFLACMIISCKGQENNVRELAAAEFAEMIKNNPNTQLLDVRTGEEYGKGHMRLMSIGTTPRLNNKSQSWTDRSRSWFTALPVNEVQLPLKKCTEWALRK
jgi:rhodanese-related sulfurtransferase